MKRVYDFFCLKPMGNISDGLRHWKVRTRISIKNNSHPKTYDRYDEKNGLHD